MRSRDVEVPTGDGVAGGTKDCRKTLPRSVGFASVFAASLGFTAFGALAIWRLAIRDMVVRRMRIDRLELDQLTVRRLQVLEKGPDQVEAARGGGNV